MSLLFALQETLSNASAIFAQTDIAAVAADTVAQTDIAAVAADTVAPAQKTLIYAAAFTSIGLAAIGSAWGCGCAATSAMGAWKKCYAQNKPAPFQLLIFAGAPLSQTIYGMIVMFIIMGKVGIGSTVAGSWVPYMLVGTFAGIAMAISAAWQGIAAAAAADAFAESGKGFTNQLMGLGIIETVAIFVLAFSIVLLSSIA